MQSGLRQRIGMLVIITAAAGVYGPPAEATLENLKTFKQTYPDRPASCKICHTGLMGRKDNLNAYGEALVKLKSDQAGRLTVEDLKAVEKDDADQDGAVNGDELKSGTDPSDPASKPALAAPSARRISPLEKLQAALNAWLIPEAYADEPAKPAAANVMRHK